MEVIGPGLSKIPLLPLNSEDLRHLADVLAGYLTYVKLVCVVAQDGGAFFFSVEELRVLKEIAQSSITLVTRIVPPSSERDEVVEHLQVLAQQFAQMLSPFVN